MSNIYGLKMEIQIWCLHYTKTMMLSHIVHRHGLYMRVSSAVVNLFMKQVCALLYCIRLIDRDANDPTPAKFTVQDETTSFLEIKNLKKRNKKKKKTRVLCG
jgi:hypothetical protein